METAAAAGVAARVAADWRRRRGRRAEAADLAAAATEAGSGAADWAVAAREADSEAAATAEVERAEARVGAAKGPESTAGATAGAAMAAVSGAVREEVAMVVVGTYQIQAHEQSQIEHVGQVARVECMR